MLYVVVFAVGVYVGKAHYDQLVTALKNGWAKLTGLFKKTP